MQPCLGQEKMWHCGHIHMLLYVELKTYLIQHPVQLVASLPDTVPIIAIHHKDQPLCVLEVVSPQRADLQQRFR